LIEKLYKPTVVFTKNGDKLAASARSVTGFDLYQAIENCSQHLIQFGGHMHAAGMTLKEEKYLDFKKAFEQEVQTTISEESKEPEEIIDLAIDFSQITDKTIRILNQFEPYGPKNMTPVFYTKNVYDSGYAKPIGKNEEHLKLYIKDQSNLAFGAVAFGKGGKFDLVKNQQLFEMIYSIEENEFNNQVNIQLRLKDLR
jgi:single-stranded-DNA-specific exonuclease